MSRTSFLSVVSLLLQDSRLQSHAISFNFSDGQQSTLKEERAVVHVKTHNTAFLVVLISFLTFLPLPISLIKVDTDIINTPLTFHSLVHKWHFTDNCRN